MTGGRRCAHCSASGCGLGEAGRGKYVHVCWLHCWAERVQRRRMREREVGPRVSTKEERVGGAGADAGRRRGRGGGRKQGCAADATEIFRPRHVTRNFGTPARAIALCSAIGAIDDLWAQMCVIYRREMDRSCTINLATAMDTNNTSIWAELAIYL